MNKKDIYDILFVLSCTIWIISWMWFAGAVYLAFTVNDDWFMVTTFWLMIMFCQLWNLEDLSKKIVEG